MTADEVGGKQKYTFADFAVPSFDFLSHKQASFKRISPSTTEEKVTAPPTSVPQRPLPILSPLSLSSNIGTSAATSPTDTWSKKYNKSLPFSLHKPHKSPEVFETKRRSMFVFDDFGLSGTPFGDEATAAEPLLFGAGSNLFDLPMSEFPVEEEIKEPC
jgi:hypothetical protein